MGTLKTWRRAYGALKDSATVGLLQIRGEFAELEVAIVKATNHAEVPPKDRHVRKVLVATSTMWPLPDAAYCIQCLSNRLSKTHNWTVALKTLIVIHRSLREGDPTFIEELLYFSQRRNHLLQLSNFKDDSSPVAWDCSAWVRTYASYLEERLECFRILKYDIEAEHLPKPACWNSRIRELCSEDLLEQLPALQQLLYRLVGCRPEGVDATKYVIQYALTLVLKESVKLYCAINDGLINLLDRFFEMPRHEAIKALHVYKRAGQQACSLSDFYEVCKGLQLARNFEFPGLREPPQSFLLKMEEYIRKAPRVVSVPREPLLQLTYGPEEGPSPEDTQIASDEPEPTPADNVAASHIELAEPPAPQVNNIGTEDLLGLDFDNTADASAMTDKNALALAIVITELDSVPTYSSGAKDFDPTGWELALVSAPSANISSPTERQLAGGLLSLNSGNDKVAYRPALQQPLYGAPAPNSFEVHNPFALYNSIDPSTAVQMGKMTQQPVDPFGVYPPTYPLPQQNMMMGAPNPFGDTTGFETFPVNSVGQPHANNNPFEARAFCNFTWRSEIAL